MKAGYICLLLLMGASVALTACGNTKNKKAESNAVGNDKDEHGCIDSAGYTWSEVQKDCIRLWEKVSAWKVWQIRKIRRILFLLPTHCK